VFLQLTGGGGEELPIPGEKFGFGVLSCASVILAASRNRRAISVDLGADVDRGLDKLASCEERNSEGEA
jgi:hypothetical protein